MFGICDRLGNLALLAQNSPVGCVDNPKQMSGLNANNYLQFALLGSPLIHLREIKPHTPHKHHSHVDMPKKQTTGGMNIHDRTNRLGSTRNLSPAHMDLLRQLLCGQVDKPRLNHFSLSPLGCSPTLFSM